MGIELNIRVTSPLDEDDRDLLSGVAVMVLAIANHEMAKNAFPETFGDGEAKREEQPSPCAFLDPDDPTVICIADVGHRGRHRFRKLAVEDAEVGVLSN